MSEFFPRLSIWLRRDFEHRLTPRRKHDLTSSWSVVDVENLLALYLVTLEWHAEERFQ